MVGAELEIIFDTLDDEALLIDASMFAAEGDRLIATIPEAGLADGAVLIESPTSDISTITVTELEGDRVQVVVTGVAGNLPTTDITLRSGIFAYALNPDTSEITEELIVTGEGEEDYVVQRATTATRTDTPLDETPQSIQVIPKDVFLEDQQVVTLGDALRNVSGVVSSSIDQRGPRFIIRGISDSVVLRDGFRLLNAGAGNFGYQELANVEQLEVLKGPSSILAGALQPGGAINLVTEQPPDEAQGEFGLRFGSRLFIEPSIDIGGPLTEDGRLKYRLNALFRNSDFYRDFDTKSETYFIAPVISWEISDRTDLTVELEASKDTRPADFAGIPAIGDRIADVDFDLVTGNADDVATTEIFQVGYRLEHRFSDEWQIRNNFRYWDFDPQFIANTAFVSTEDLQLLQGAGILPPFFNFEEGDFARIWARSEQPRQSYEVQTNVVGEFKTGAIEHTLLAGVDFWRQNAQSTRDPGPTNPFATLELPPINIFNPPFPQRTRPATFSQPVIETGETQTENLGFYVQDQLAFGDKFFLLAGLRYDTVDIKNITFATDTETTQNSDAFTPRLGLVYKPIEELSLYTSYSTSFLPTSLRTLEGELLEPEEGRQFEIGARAELFDERLIANLAFFDITKKDVAVSIFNPTGENFGSSIGEQNSCGIELDIIGELAPGWDIVANYAYTDAEIVEGSAPTLLGGLFGLPPIDISGNDLFGVPEHNFNLWTNYRVQSGKLEGLGFGLGVNFVGERPGDNFNSFTVDDYLLTNAAISYEKDDWRAAINFRNLFDVDYIDSTENSREFENRPGEGFTVIGSFSAKF